MEARNAPVAQLRIAGYTQLITAYNILADRATCRSSGRASHRAVNPSSRVAIMLAASASARLMVTMSPRDLIECTSPYITAQPPAALSARSSSGSLTGISVRPSGTASLTYLMQIELTQWRSSVSVCDSP